MGVPDEWPSSMRQLVETEPGLQADWCKFLGVTGRGAAQDLSKTRYSKGLTALFSWVPDARSPAAHGVEDDEIGLHIEFDDFGDLD